MEFHRHRFAPVPQYVQNPPEEVFFMASKNLLVEPDAANVTWVLLPEGDHGLRAPAMYNPNTTVMEEGHVLFLKSSGAYSMARTDRGYIAAAATSDPTARGGWEPTELARYWDPRRPLPVTIPLADIKLPNRSNAMAALPSIYHTALKNERGPFTPKLHSSGLHLLIFYNVLASHRNPYFLSAGLEVLPESGGAAILAWSQPELVLYDRLCHSGTSAGGYPDFLFSHGEVFLSAAQKQVPGINSTAYMIRVDDELISMVLTQHTRSTLPMEDRLAASVTGTDVGKRIPLTLARWPHMDRLTERRQGVSALLQLSPRGVGTTTQTLLHSGGVWLGYGASGNPELELTASPPSCSHGCAAKGSAAPPILSNHVMDPACAALATSLGMHTLGVVVDAGAGLVTWFVDGLLCDGGGAVATGWQVRVLLA